MNAEAQDTEATAAVLLGENEAPGAAFEPYALTRPNDTKWSAEQFTAFERQAREMGLDNVMAQKLLDVAHTNQKAHDQAHAKQLQTWEQEARADMHMGGEGFAATVAYANAGLSRFDPHGKLLHILQKTGYERNPDVLRFLSAIGRAHAEDAVVLGGAGYAARPLHERLYAK